MNTVRACACCVFLLFALLRSAGAQPLNPASKDADQPRPALFADLPDSIAVDFSQLTLIANMANGAVVKTVLSPGFTIQGTVVSVAETQTPLMRSVVVRLSSKLGAAFALSRIEEAPGKVVFLGRMLSRRHSDAFELVNTPEQYYLVKRSYAEMSEE